MISPQKTVFGHNTGFVEYFLHLREYLTQSLRISTKELGFSDFFWENHFGIFAKKNLKIKKNLQILSISLTKVVNLSYNTSSTTVIHKLKATVFFRRNNRQQRWKRRSRQPWKRKRQKRRQFWRRPVPVPNSCCQNQFPSFIKLEISRYCSF